MKVLVSGNDQLIIEWTYKTFGVLCTKVDMALGVVEDDALVGACFFQAHNGPDVELSYFGPNTLTLDVVKQIAKIAVEHLGVSRITIRTAKSNKTLTKNAHKLGFVYEGVRHHAYGNEDAVMYGLFGEKLARLAGRILQ